MRERGSDGLTSADVRRVNDICNSPHAEFIRRLRAERKAKGLTLAQMSERSGIDQPALSRLERGLSTNPTVETLARYAAGLGARLRLSLESEESLPAQGGGMTAIASDGAVVRFSEASGELPKVNQQRRARVDRGEETSGEARS
jgi:transcriptional regulator with XRE-family HTH domain